MSYFVSIVDPVFRDMWCLGKNGSYQDDFEMWKLAIDCHGDTEEFATLICPKLAKEDRPDATNIAAFHRWLHPKDCSKLIYHNEINDHPIYRDVADVWYPFRGSLWCPGACDVLGNGGFWHLADGSPLLHMAVRAGVYRLGGMEGASWPIDGEFPRWWRRSGNAKKHPIVNLDPEIVAA